MNSSYSNVLTNILAETKTRVESAKASISVKTLKESPLFGRATVSLSEQLLRPDLLGVIAEFKRRSPSRGVLNESVDVKKVTTGYISGGASALSILTEPFFFNGSLEDLTKARAVNNCPILRKEFIIDEYQLFEAKAAGADAVLLIAAALSADEIRSFSDIAADLGMEVLAEVHQEEELDKVLLPTISCIGVNNRDLKTLSVSLERSFELVEKIPAQFVKVAESGIRKPEDLKSLRSAGFSGFLVGEAFMVTSDPVNSCREFIDMALEHKIA